MNLSSKLKVSGFLLAGCLFAGSANAAWWVPILTCDSGAARVEVDLGERRDVRIVITNQNIKNYLTSVGVNDFGSSDVVSARVDQGIFYSPQFSGFERKGISALGYGGGIVATLKVYRYGQGLQIVANQEYGDYCFELNSYLECVGRFVQLPKKDLGNWYFQNCQEVSIPN